MTFLWAGLLWLLVVVPVLVGIYAWSPATAAAHRRTLLEPGAHPGSTAGLLADPPPPALRGVRPRGRAAWPWRSADPAVVLSVPVNETTVILAMDVSGSMCATDIRPTRLAVAQEAATRFIERQASRTQIGIVAFSGLAAIIQAPTGDRETLDGRHRQPADGSLDGHRQRHPGRHRRHRRDRPERRPEPDRGSPGSAADPGRARRATRRPSSSS